MRLRSPSTLRSRASLASWMLIDINDSQYDMKNFDIKHCLIKIFKFVYINVPYFMSKLALLFADCPCVCLSVCV